MIMSWVLNKLKLSSIKDIDVSAYFHKILLVGITTLQINSNLNIVSTKFKNTNHVNIAKFGMLGVTSHPPY